MQASQQVQAFQFRQMIEHIRIDVLELVNIQPDNFQLSIVNECVAFNRVNQVVGQKQSFEFVERPQIVAVNFAQIARNHLNDGQTFEDFVQAAREVMHGFVRD